MRFFIEFHIIQNFAPSNLNRDDTGSPKEAFFGGHRRARISSQCLKSSMRTLAKSEALIPKEYLGTRTKKLKALLAARLSHRSPEEVTARVQAILSTVDLKLKDDGKTEYLLFLGEGEVAGLASVLDEHWDALDVPIEASDDKKEKKSKKAPKIEVPKEVGKKIKDILNGAKAVDVALFGRMLADMPVANQDAACQVAHAISTHRVEREFDYFTALDDEGGQEEMGAGMIGHVEFNSASFYRYAVLDPQKLLSNLQNDHDLTLLAVKAFTELMVRAIPSGKQNSFAAHNPPAFVGVCLRHKSPINLSNAFEMPVLPSKDHGSLSGASVHALSQMEQKLSKVYGDNAEDCWAYLDLTGEWSLDLGQPQESVAALADWVHEELKQALGG